MLPLALSIAALTGSSAHAAYAFCMEPRAPNFFGHKPSKPICATMRNCSSFEVNAYRDDVDRYYRDLRQYVEDIDKYYKNASDYVECMSKLD